LGMKTDGKLPERNKEIPSPVWGETEVEAKEWQSSEKKRKEGEGGRGEKTQKPRKRVKKGSESWVGKNRGGSKRPKRGVLRKKKA